MIYSESLCKSMNDAKDIAKYIRILNGEIDNRTQMQEAAVVDLGTSLRGVEPGNVYAFDGGTKWLEIIADAGDCWEINQGATGYISENYSFIKKSTISQLIKEFYLEPCNAKQLMEVNNSAAEFNQYLEKVDRYLMLNYQKSTADFDINWKDLFEDGFSPSEAAEYLLID